MKRKWPTRILCIFLALLICISWPMKAYAVGLEGMLLTRPEIALLILAAFGIIYMIASGPALYDTMEDALRAAPSFNAEEFEHWIAEAEAGLIRLADAPQWIIDSIKGWAAGFFAGTMYYSEPVLGPDGVPIYNTGDTIGPGATVYSVHDVQQYFILDEPATKVAYYHYIQHDNGFVSLYVYDCFVATDHISGTYYNLATGYEREFSIGRREDEELWAGNLSAYYYQMTEYVGIAVDSLEYRHLMARLTSYYRLPDTGEAVKHDVLFEQARKGLLDTTIFAPCHPLAFVGGVKKTLDAGIDMTTITVPNLHLPPVYHPGNAEAELDILLQKLKSGAITWEQFLDQVALLDQRHGTSYLTVYKEAYYPIYDYGVADQPVTYMPDPVTSDVDLTGIFPFCIPFDIYEFFSLLAAEPRAPVFSWVISVPQLGVNYPITVDLSAWDTVAELFRTLELLAFIVGLAMVTRNKILRS